MVDLKRLKGTYDLAQLNHSSLNNDGTKAALEAAKDAYEAALDADQEDTSKNDRNAGPGIVEANQAKSTPKKATGTSGQSQTATKASNDKSGGTGSDKSSADTTKKGDPAADEDEKKSE